MEGENTLQGMNPRDNVALLEPLVQRMGHRECVPHTPSLECPAQLTPSPTAALAGHTAEIHCIPPKG